MQCRICSDDNEKAVYQVREMMLGFREVFTYFQCNNCKCLQIEEVPENLEKYYSGNYYSFRMDPQIHFRGFFKRWLKRVRDYYVLTNKGLAGRIVQTIIPTDEVQWLNFRNVELNKSSKILDVGSGTGTTCYIFHNAGFRNIVGIDPYLSQDIIYRNGLKIKKLSLFDVKDQDWDMVMFNHSFEHVPNPLDYLRKVHSILRNNGMCVLRIPTVSSFAWEHYKTDWVQLDAPRHLFLHSISSIHHMAKVTGYQTVNISYESTELQFIGSELYRMDIPLFDEEKSYYRGNKALFSKEQSDAFKKKAEQLNKEQSGDSIAVILRKI